MVEDVLVEVLSEVFVDGVVVEEETGEDITGHMSVERLLFVDQDMVRHGKGRQKKIRQTLTLRTTTNKQGCTTLSPGSFKWPLH